MPIDYNHTGSRSEKRAKRRKTNIILNTLIAIVIILIILVGKNIFFSAPKSEPQQTSGQEITKKEDKSNDNEEQVAEEETKEQTEEEELNKEEETDNSGSIEKESNEPNVEKVIVNPDWKPIGTTQTGHQPSYEMGSVDWEEKEKAAAYAINAEIENMTTWWLRRGENPENQSILTVSEKGSPDTYEVYVEWVDGQGWKPTEVKKLIENDRK